MRDTGQIPLKTRVRHRRPFAFLFSVSQKLTARYPSRTWPGVPVAPGVFS
jgi:hypothetical protein